VWGGAKPNPMKTCTLFCCALLAAAAMQAQIIHVPGDYPTIQQGINAATSGDTVLVAEGTYYEQINFLGTKPLMVASQFLMDGDTSHINNTIIDGSQITDPDSASVVYFVHGEDTTSILCGFTIQHGKGTLTIDMELPAREGGGIFISSSGAKVIRNHITENHLNDTLPGSVEVVSGAGLCTEWKIDDHWIVVDHNLIDHNTVYSSGYEAACSGLGVFYNCRITHNTISDNTATGKSNCHAIGGGFACGIDPEWTNLVTAILRYNLIQNNVTESENSFASGAGGCLQAVTGIFSDNIVTGNISNGWTYSGAAGGIDVFAPKEGVAVRNNIFSENTSNSWTGGLHIEAMLNNPDPAIVLVENNYFLNNEAMKGGGFTALDNPVLLQNNVFSGNHATDKGGGAYLMINPAVNLNHPATLINNSFYGNSAEVSGGAVFSVGIRNLLVMNSIFWKDTSNSLSGQEIYIANLNDSIEIAHSNVDTALIRGIVVDGGGNINEDPLFEDPVSLSINAASPCFNAGTEEFTCLCGDTHVSPAYDVTGMPRPQYGIYDIGAYEGLYTGIRNRLPAGSVLSCHNYPNPFITSTTYTYNLNEPCQVTLKVFNNLGQLVAEPVSSYQQKGDQKVSWNAGNLPCGMYYYLLEAGGKTGSGKIVKY
jgi:hypothetical protein